jgi:uncharacterized Zn-binding protein involved in type VI secretion
MNAKIFLPILVALLLIGIVMAGFPAARLGDITTHGGTVTTGSSNVYMGGLPAARVGDWATCPLVVPGEPDIPHVGGYIIGGSTTVRINNMPAARAGVDIIEEQNGFTSLIQIGEPTVLIG